MLRGLCRFFFVPEENVIGFSNVFFSPSVACIYLPLLAEQRDGEEEPSAV